MDIITPHTLIAASLRKLKHDAALLSAAKAWLEDFENDLASLATDDDDKAELDELREAIVEAEKVSR